MGRLIDADKLIRKMRIDMDRMKSIRQMMI